MFTRRLGEIGQGSAHCAGAAFARGGRALKLLAHWLQRASTIPLTKGDAMASFFARALPILITVLALPVLAAEDVTRMPATEILRQALANYKHGATNPPMQSCRKPRRELVRNASTRTVFTPSARGNREGDYTRKDYV